MRFACLTKTYFTHANKLKHDGNRTLFNEGSVNISCEPDTAEGQRIQDDGVYCPVYRPELWGDTDALQALMCADNDDATIEMGEGEVQALGRVESAINSCADKSAEGQRPGIVTLDTVFAEMKRSGLRAYSEEQTKTFIEFRFTLTAPVAQCFRSCVFHSICGRVIVPHGGDQEQEEAVRKKDGLTVKL